VPCAVSVVREVWPDKVRACFSKLQSAV
jgi:hypothetical protein